MASFKIISDKEENAERRILLEIDLSGESTIQVVFVLKGSFFKNKQDLHRLLPNAIVRRAAMNAVRTHVAKE